MTPDRRAPRAVEQACVHGFTHSDVCLPDEHPRERPKGSILCGGGRITFVFGEDEGREHLEFHASHRMGEDHARIYEDGGYVDLPGLCSMFSVDPKIPGDRKRKEAGVQRRYRETFEDLIATGLFENEPVPGSLAIDGHLVPHGDGGEDAGVNRCRQERLPCARGRNTGRRRKKRGLPGVSCRVSQPILREISLPNF